MLDVGAVSGMVGGIGGLIGSLLSGGGDDEAQSADKAAIQAFQDLKIPEIDKALALNSYQQGGTLTPELIQKLNLNADKATTLTENPENRARQEASLNALKQMSQTGMSAQDLAQMAQARSQSAQDTQAKTNQLLQQAQARGQLGSGDTLAAQLMANQQSGQNASKAAMDTAAQASQARQNALSSYANLSGQVRGQDLNTQQYNTQNDILRQQFLDQNALARQNANVSAGNNANMYNTQRQQGVSDTNTGTQNAELQRQVQAQQQMYQDQLAKAQGVASGNQHLASGIRGDSKESAQSISNIATGAGNTLGAAGKLFGSSGPSVQSMSYGDAMDSYDKKYGQGRGMYEGGRVEGDAPFKGDSPHNDIIQKMLSPDEIVVPRTEASNESKAKKFVEGVFKSEKKDVSKYDRNESLLNLLADLHSKSNKK